MYYGPMRPLYVKYFYRLTLIKQWRGKRNFECTLHIRIKALNSRSENFQNFYCYDCEQNFVFDTVCNSISILLYLIQLLLLIFFLTFNILFQLKIDNRPIHTSHIL